MRGITPRSRTLAMLDMLESRTLLAANWAGTWQVSGVDLTMRSLPPNGALTVTYPTTTVALTPAAGNDYTAVLTSKVGKQVRTDTRTLHANGQELVGDFTSDDTAANGQVIHWKTYIRMMQVDESVRMFDMTSVGYTDSNGAQRIYELNMYAGIAAQQKLQVVNFPYVGDYSFHGFTVTADTQNNVMSTDAAEVNLPGTITQTGGRNYSISTDNGSPSAFVDKSGRLARIVIGPTLDGKYVRDLQMYYRGPNGRLYYRGGGMSANINVQRTDAMGAIPVGQILHGWTTAGYSDVAPCNFAPALVPGVVTLNPINEDQTESQGTTIADLLNGSTITDWNPSARKGVAIVGTNSRYGTWEYSTNGGAAWQSVGKVSAGHALLLAASDQNQIRFVPKANYNGTVAKAITFRAWDQSAGTNGTFASAAKAGGFTAFSTARSYATLQVKPVDDAPVLSGTLPELTYAGSPVRIGSGLRITDVDNKLLSGATVTVLPFVTETDVLVYTGSVKGITVAPVDAVGPMVVLTGQATLSAYLSAIRAITFAADTSIGGDRTIRITLNDGTLDSNAITQTVHVAPGMVPLAAPVFSDAPLTGDLPAVLA